MRDGVRIVNAARGALVDEERARAGDRVGKVAGAALDVFSEEPYTGPLLELENVVVDAAPRRLDRRGAGPRRRDRRRAGRRRARGRARHERASTSRSSAPRISRCSARTSRSPPSSAGSRWSSPAAAPRGSRLSFNGAIADYDTRLLTVAALNGAFQGRVEQPVNYVNAPLIAAERGIEVERGAVGARRATTRTSSRSRSTTAAGVASPARRSAPSTATGSSGALGFEHRDASSRRGWSSSATTTSRA